MRKINFGARPIDMERIRLALALYPDIDNPTDALRLGLKRLEDTADPVALEQARRAVAKRSKEKAK